MPIYEYQCKSCGRTLEKRQKLSDPQLTVCPTCSGQLERLISAPAVQFKGGGWYADLYSSSKGGNKPATSGESGGSSDSSEAKTGTSSESGSTSNSNSGENSSSAKSGGSSSDSSSSSTAASSSASSSTPAAPAASK